MSFHVIIRVFWCLSSFKIGTNISLDFMTNQLKLIVQKKCGFRSWKGSNTWTPFYITWEIKLSHWEQAKCSPVWLLWCVFNVLATNLGANGRDKTVETVEKCWKMLKMVENTWKQLKMVESSWKLFPEGLANGKRFWKNPAYGRQSISRPMRIVAPMP